jgi:hypothetical protein
MVYDLLMKPKKDSSVRDRGTLPTSSGALSNTYLEAETERTGSRGVKENRERIIGALTRTKSKLSLLYKSKEEPARMIV